MIRHILDVLGIGWSGHCVLHSATNIHVVTRFARPDLKYPPKTIMRHGSAYGDTGRYDSAGGRIYRHNYGVFHYIAGTE